MAKFITSNELNLEIEKLFEAAEEQLVLISPYIKLHDRYASSLKTKKDNHKLAITIVFGKNEEDMSKSMKEEDFNFFKTFPNITIHYEKRLHAKYYCNDNTAIITSMNLHSYSQDNNIEAGVMTKAFSLGGLINVEDSFDIETMKYFQRVIEQSELLFQNTPQFESTILGLSKRYLGSKVKVDKLTEFFANKQNYDSFSRKKEEKKKAEPIEHIQVKNTGYCIRTGKPIEFNPKFPMTQEAYKEWAEFKNDNYKEKYCHFSGEPSNGETTFSKPILWKNWNEAKKKFKIK